MAPIDSATTDHAMAPSIAALHCTARVSNRNMNGTHASAAAANWITEPMRRSNTGQKCFW
ncbi:hypothetical protein D3C87_2178700 [compost metagenome]